MKTTRKFTFYFVALCTAFIFSACEDNDVNKNSTTKYEAVNVEAIYLLNMPQTDNGEPWDMGFLDGAEPDIMFYVYKNGQLDYETGYYEDADISKGPGFKINRTYGPNDNLKIKIYDYDGATDNDYIGEVECSLSKHNGESEGYVSRGQIKIKLQLEWYK